MARLSLWREGNHLVLVLALVVAVLMQAPAPACGVQPLVDPYQPSVGLSACGVSFTLRI